MNKQKLITIIRDSLVSGNQKEAEDAIDEILQESALNFDKWKHGLIGEAICYAGDDMWEIINPSKIPIEILKVTGKELYDIYLAKNK